MSNYYDDATASDWSMNGSEWNVMSSDIQLGKSHVASDGSDHAFIDQDVTTTGSPTFADGAVTGSWTAGFLIGDGSQITGIDINILSDVDINSPVDGEALVYASGSWVNSTVAAGGGASYTYKEKINGEIYTGNLGYFVVPDELNGKEIKEVRIALLGLGDAAVKVDVRKNGTATTDSIFTSDVEIQIDSAATATNGVYQSGCDTVGSTVGTAGTTLDSALTTVTADDVLYIYVTQTGTSVKGTDLIVEVIMG